ncbi:MAG: hypothetical protein ABW061_18545 [Polyangiaceae bacterium]
MPASRPAPKPTPPRASAAKPSVKVTPHEQPPPDSLSVSEIPDESPAPVASGQDQPAPSPLIIDQAQEIGPAGQMTATEHGVVMLNRSDELLLAKAEPLARSTRPEKARFSRVKGGSNDFFAVARGPLVARNKAYWVRDGKLVRRSLDNATPLEVLANDARNGTRVVGADLADAPPHAVYISNPLLADEAPRAKLWVEGAGVVTVSPEGAGSSSVAVASTGQELFLVGIDARSAMTPMHGRLVRFKAGKPELDPDVVMWVGSSSQTLSEVFAATTPLGVRAFLPIERDTSHFGLVMLELGVAPHMDPRTVYRGYPNGIDVAPAASAAFCGTAFVVYARPETPNPESDEVLEIAEITAAGLGPAERVDSARGFANISLAAATSSGVLAYVADFRTYATTVRCAHKK